MKKFSTFLADYMLREEKQMDEQHKVGDTASYTKGGKKYKQKIVAIKPKNGQMRYELDNAGFVYHSDLDESIEESRQIDEISDKKLDAYRQKAFKDQPASDDGSNKYRKRKFGRDLAFAKQTGRAKVRATKEDLDEASMPLGIRSAMSSVHNVSVTAGQMVNTAKSMKDFKSSDVEDMNSEIDWMMERLKEAKKSLSKVKL